MKELSLALGGGGARGVAHIGVIRCLENNGFKIAAIAGTSAGGAIGACYAAGIPLPEIELLITRLNKSRLFGHKRHEGPSILGLSGFSNILESILGDRTFGDVKIPFACRAVDINTHQEVILNQGRLIDAVLATIAVPGIFPPLQIGKAILVDGGVYDPVPVNLARWLAPKIPVLAVCLSPSHADFVKLPGLHIPQESPIPTPILNQLLRLPLGQALKIFAESMEAASCMLAEQRIIVDKPDILVRPDVVEIGLLDRIDPADLIYRGEKATKEILPKINQAFSIPGILSRHFRTVPTPGILLTSLLEKS